MSSQMVLDQLSYDPLTVSYCAKPVVYDIADPLQQNCRNFYIHD